MVEKIIDSMKSTLFSRMYSLENDNEIMEIASEFFRVQLTKHHDILYIRNVDINKRIQQFNNLFIEYYHSLKGFMYEFSSSLESTSSSEILENQYLPITFSKLLPKYGMDCVSSNVYCFDVGVIMSALSVICFKHYSRFHPQFISDIYHETYSKLLPSTLTNQDSKVTKGEEFYKHHILYGCHLKYENGVLKISRNGTSTLFTRKNIDNDDIEYVNHMAINMDDVLVYINILNKVCKLGKRDGVMRRMVMLLLSPKHEEQYIKSININKLGIINKSSIELKGCKQCLVDVLIGEGGDCGVCYSPSSVVAYLNKISM